MSDAWSPRSTTRPLSITTMSSTKRVSPRRWLTISAVRPAIQDRTRSQMSPSAAGSTP